MVVSAVSKIRRSNAFVVMGKNNAVQIYKRKQHTKNLLDWIKKIWRGPKFASYKNSNFLKTFTQYFCNLK